MMVAYGGEIGVGIEMEVLEEALKDPGTEATGGGTHSDEGLA